VEINIYLLTYYHRAQQQLTVFWCKYG